MRTLLKDYFSTTWLERDRSLDQYEYTGWSLLDKIQPDELVLDVGCGTNPFKKHLGDRVYGIDITDVGADQVVAIEDFKSDKLFDVAFCLGSINFGDKDVIYSQIKQVTECLKPSSRIYWRCNPGLQDHNNEECKNIDFFDWSYGYHRYFADCFGYSIKHMCMDRNRIYAEWIQ